MGKSGTQKQAQREDLFDRYSQNLSVVKQHPHIHVTPEINDSYLCPLCYRIFPRDALTIPDILTLDHIPSAKLGGRYGGAVLVCKQCNNDAGKLFDSHLKRILEGRDFLTRIPGSSLQGWYTLVEGTKMTATITHADDGTLMILGHPERTNPNYVAAENALLSSLPPKGAMGWKFGGTMGNELFANVGLLRYAYLVSSQ